MKLIRMIPFAEELLFRSRCRSIREPKAIGPVVYGADTEGKVVSGLKSVGVKPVDFRVDLEKYKKYLEAAEYFSRHPKYYGTFIHEKSLEHFIAAELLGLKASDTYIDIASANSPVPEIYGRLFGCKAYRQDLHYPEGLNGDTIGGSAAKMPVPDGFADKMALHCSLEHFEGNSDMEFIKELGRVLKKGGKCCVVPFYLFDRYAIQTDPSAHSSVEFEKDAVVFCERGWDNRHGRFYDPAHFKGRILSNLKGLECTVYRIVNFKDIDKSCYARFALLIEKP